MSQVSYDAPRQHLPRWAKTIVKVLGVAAAIAAAASALLSAGKLGDAVQGVLRYDVRTAVVFGIAAANTAEARGLHLAVGGWTAATRRQNLRPAAAGLPAARP